MATNRPLLRNSTEFLVARARVMFYKQMELTKWPRDSKGKFLPHVGYPKGLEAWMQYNAARA